METLDVVRIVLGTAIIVVAAFFATRRILFLQGMIRSGQPAVGRTSHVGKRAELEGTQVLGQKKLLQWAIPGIAHVFAFWGFLILGITVVTAASPTPSKKTGITTAHDTDDPASASGRATHNTTSATNKHRAAINNASSS